VSGQTQVSAVEGTSLRGKDVEDLLEVLFTAANRGNFYFLQVGAKPGRSSKHVQNFPKSAEVIFSWLDKDCRIIGVKGDFY
jgi:hypothetical protein